MRRLCWAALGLGSILLAGCFDEPGTESSFRRPAPGAPPAVAPASTEAAARVDTVGRRILAANPQVGAKPMFLTIGAPEPEIFHRGTEHIYITEGLVRQCASDGQLAAVLCAELGKMVSEREALAPASVRQPNRPPPIDTGIGKDAGWGTAPDQTRLAELANADRERRQRRAPPPPPDPQALARVYLLRAGFHDDDQTTVTPLLRAANSHSAFEKQMGRTSPPESKP